MEGQAVGVMVTASHNPESDNGVKLIDPNGQMLDSSWESYAETFINAQLEEIPAFLAQLCTDFQLDIEKLDCNHPRVFLGRDTRMHSKHYSDLVREGIELINGWTLDLGQLTTPIIHYLVLKTNEEGLREKDWFEEDGYFNCLGSGYVELIQTVEGDGKAVNVFLDAANGIGGLKIQHMWMWLLEKALDAGIEMFELEVFNNVGDGPLNHLCGADHVKTTKQPPSHLPHPKLAMTNKRIMSVDGDADRGIFSYFTPEGEYRILDGDKWGALIGMFLKECLETAELTNRFRMGVVQTAYANGATTEFYKNNGFTTVLTKTGVKHLHAEAQKFDVGLYCEANGHATCLFSKKFVSHLSEMVTWGLEESKATAARRLLAINSCLNQATGDSTSMLLTSQGILTIRGWNYQEWDALYNDLPSRLSKIEVEDKSLIVNNEDETQVVAPPALQQKLDELMARVPRGRVFVRPSGTENMLRVYAEAETQRACDDLCLKALQEVHAICGGTGRRPNQV